MLVTSWCSRCLSVIGLAVALGLECSLPSKEQGMNPSTPADWRRVSWGTLGVMVPARLIVRLEQRVDFAIYTFASQTDTTRVLMRAYVGGHPSFPAGVPSGVTIGSEIRACCKFQTAVWGSDSSLSRSSLATPLRLDERGTRVHFGFQGLTKGEAALADSVIRSLWQAGESSDRGCLTTGRRRQSQVRRPEPTQSGRDEVFSRSELAFAAGF